MSSLPLFRDPRDYTPKELALLKIHLLVYRKELRAARVEYVCPAYIKSLEELMKRIEEEIEGAIAL